ncbi:uncharacterized protein CTRU02_207841 [Colletotrichum truncatum]|uniref:Uncharacterized protein n=1 Tax=Colletotrichum truncatum TaxID=5467 RepID=A0ACC3Z216_COLTU|nr:uncharacterized protein CTRU02_15575 [Colletotrichum truncatum]KAF6780918.1 hypothetical protein CTRU02_15575 [Colletotrichum truncatum]
MFAKSLSLAAITAAFFTTQAAADAWENQGCTEVSFDTLFAVKNAELPIAGPKGLYATTVDDQCVYVDASPGSAFSKEQPEYYNSLIAGAKASQVGGLDFLSPNPARGLQERQASCGQTCRSSATSPKTCNSCSCKYDYTFCGQGGACTAYWKCK